VIIGTKTRSLGATANTCGRNTWSRSTPVPRYAPQHPQNAPAGTTEPHPAQAVVGTSSVGTVSVGIAELVDSQFDDIVVLSAIDLTPTSEPNAARPATNGAASEP
jgi:hypothetical protein